MSDLIFYDVINKLINYLKKIKYFIFFSKKK